MKKIVLLLGILFIFILKVGLVTTFVDVGDEFEFNGIKYKVTSENPNEVEVIESTVKPIGHIVIPANVNSYAVTAIGDYAFFNSSTWIGNRWLTNITIPDSVVYIGDYAFFGCSEITNITIPNSVTYIGNWAFDYCRGLTSITIPDSVTYIGNAAFSSCSGLTSITISDNVTSIGDSAFLGCRGLTSITIPDNVTSIGDGAFAYCRGLTSITIPDNVTSIGDRAFEDCSGLTSITIGVNITSIGNEAFTQPNASNVPIYYLKDSYNASYIENYSFPSNFELVANTRIDGNNDISFIENPNFF